MSGDVALTFLLQMVRDVYIEHKNLKDDAQHELQLLSYELSELQSLLEEAATKPEKSDLFKEKERQMRQLVYEIEDAIGICSTKRLQQRQRISSAGSGETLAPKWNKKSSFSEKKEWDQS